MTQQQPYKNGTKVRFSSIFYNGDMAKDFDREAIIRGFTHLNDSLYYVLECQTESGETMLFIRSHDKVTIDTALHQYIGDYIELEAERLSGILHLPTGMAQVRRWIKEAINAYEGGAR